MKKTFPILLCGILLCSSGFSQNSYYQAGTERIDLFLNKKSVLVYLDTFGYASSIFTPALLPSVEVQPTEIPSSYFFLNFVGEVEGDLKSKLAPLLAQPHQILHANYGYKTQDGMPLWLSKRLTYLPNASFSQSKMQDILGAYPGASQVQTAQGIRMVEAPAPLDALKLSQDLASTGMFDWVHPDFFAPLEPMNDPLYTDQFYLDNLGQTIDGSAGISNIDINAPEAWALLSSSRQVMVGVIDNGVEAHQDLQDTAGMNRLLPGYSAYNLTPSGNPYLTTEMHGQACAGIIAALHDNNSGIRGINQDALVLPVYFPWLITPSNVVEIANGIKWAYNNGAEVMNNSYGYPSCLSNPFPVLTDAIDSALIDGRGGLGTVMVFAAGNDTGCVRFPGNLPQTLTAGAIDKNGNLSTYSNRGPEIDVVAPSSGTINDNGVRVTDRMGANGLNFVGATDISDINYSRQFGGTSSATAQVTGVASLMLKEVPYLTADSVSAIIKRTATDMGVVGYDTLFGHGRLNAFAAIQAAKDTVLPVLWLGLRVNNAGAGLQLDWEAVQEEGSHFEVWRQGRYLSEVAISNERKYVFLDKNPPSGRSSYRVVWVGIDGERISSAAVEAYFEPEGKIEVQQKGPQWIVSGKGLQQGPGTLGIRDLSGKLVYSERLDVPDGQFSHRIPASNFSQSLYFVEFSDVRGWVKRMKFVSR